MKGKDRVQTYPKNHLMRQGSLCYINIKQVVMVEFKNKRTVLFLQTALSRFNWTENEATTSKTLLALCFLEPSLLEKFSQ